MKTFLTIMLVISLSNLFAQEKTDSCVRIKLTPTFVREMKCDTLEYIRNYVKERYDNCFNHHSKYGYNVSKKDYKKYENFEVVKGGNDFIIKMDKGFPHAEHFSLNLEIKKEQYLIQFNILEAIPENDSVKNIILKYFGEELKQFADKDIEKSLSGIYCCNNKLGDFEMYTRLEKMKKELSSINAMKDYEILRTGTISNPSYKKHVNYKYCVKAFLTKKNAKEYDELNNERIIDVKNIKNNKENRVQIIFDDKGKELLKKFSAENIGKKIAISFGEQIFSHFIITSIIEDGKLEIGEGLNKDEIFKSYFFPLLSMKTFYCDAEVIE